MKKRQEVPGVGAYDVERSRNFFDQNTPQYSMPKSKNVMFNEAEIREKQMLPDIGKYES